MKHLQICMFNIDFYLQQVQILHLVDKTDLLALYLSGTYCHKTP